MKKIFVISAMLASLLAIAGPKADIEKANQLIKENKNAEAVKILKASKLVKGEEVEFEAVNRFLGDNAQDEKEKINYYRKVLAVNPKSKSPNVVASAYNLVNLLKTDAEKIKELEALVKRFEANEAVDVFADLAYLYDKTNNKSKFNETVKKVSKEHTENFNILLATNYIKGKEGQKAYDTLVLPANSKNNEIKLAAFRLLAENELLNLGNKENYENYLKSMEVISPTKETYEYMAYSYFVVEESEKALSFIKKAIALDKNNESLHLVALIYAGATNKDKEVDTLVESIKKIDKEVKNMNVAIYFIQNGVFKQAERYADKALKAKEKDANYFLALAQANQGKFDEALKNAEKALKEKTQGAQELINEIKKAKK